MGKTVKCKSQICLNEAIRKLREEGWKISSDEFFEEGKHHQRLYCVKMYKQESSLPLE